MITVFASEQVVRSSGKIKGLEGWKKQAFNDRKKTDDSKQSDKPAPASNREIVD